MEDKPLSNVHGELPIFVSPLARSNENQAVIDSNMADEDMEVDMVGGKSVGRVDMVVPRSSSSKTMQDGVSQKQDTKGPISRVIDSPLQQLCAQVERHQRKDDKPFASAHLMGSLEHHQVLNSVTHQSFICFLNHFPHCYTLCLTGAYSFLSSWFSEEV